jgi:hypothetical protein
VVQLHTMSFVKNHARQGPLLPCPSLPSLRATNLFERLSPLHSNSETRLGATLGGETEAPPSGQACPLTDLHRDLYVAHVSPGRAAEVHVGGTRRLFLASGPAYLGADARHSARYLTPRRPEFMLLSAIVGNSVAL